MENRKQYPGLQCSQHIYRTILTLALFAFLVLMVAIPVHAHSASGTGDLMSGIPVGEKVDEHSYLPNSCGVVAATMILDYYLPPSSPVHAPIDISTVGNYVKETYNYDAKTNSYYPAGSTTTQVQTGLEAASNDPAWNYGNPLKATWSTTDDADWFTTLKSELEAMRPVVVFLANGGTLGDPFQYGHFIVVSGYTSDDSIIYHDPWDGKAHTHSNADFARDWGTTWEGNPPWLYMQITASFTPSTPTPILTPTQPPTPTPTNTPTPTATSVSTPTPVLVPTPTPTPTPPTLVVNPTNLLPSICPWYSEAFRCTVTVMETSNSQGNLNWTASSTGSATITPSSGTLTPGQSMQVTIFAGCDSETIAFVGSGNTVSATWRCPTVTVTPSSLNANSTACTFFSGSYDCIVTLTETADSPENANWIADSGGYSIQFKPAASGTLSPGQSVTVYIALPCQNLTFAFYSPYNNGGIYLPVSWTCP